MKSDYDCLSFKVFAGTFVWVWGWVHMDGEHGEGNGLSELDENWNWNERGTLNRKVTGDAAGDVCTEDRNECGWFGIDWVIISRLDWIG